jgi:hypothetical protein
MLHEDQYTLLIISHSVLLRMRNVSEKNCIENQNTHFMFNNFFILFFPLIDNVVKYFTAWQATDNKIIHAHCMLDT